MTADIQFKNNGFSTLQTSGGISAGATSGLDLDTGHGSRFPSVTSGDNLYFYVTLDDEAGTVEVIKVTENSGDTFDTYVRAQEGTSAQAWPAGTVIELRVTAQGLADLAADEKIYKPSVVQAAMPTPTYDSEESLLLTPSLSGNLDLPTTDVVKGRRYLVVNRAAVGSGYDITVRASGGATVLSLEPQEGALFMAVQASPSLATHWEALQGDARLKGAPRALASVFLTPVADVNQDLPTTDFLKGQGFFIMNRAAFSSGYDVTVRSSGLDTVGVLRPQEGMLVLATQDTPTTAAHWEALFMNASGKSGPGAWIPLDEFEITSPVASVTLAWTQDTDAERYVLVAAGLQSDYAATFDALLGELLVGGSPVSVGYTTLDVSNTAISAAFYASVATFYLLFKWPSAHASYDFGSGAFTLELPVVATPQPLWKSQGSSFIGSALATMASGHIRNNSGVLLDAGPIEGVRLTPENGSNLVSGKGVLYKIMR